jgi:hypothetical protein
MIKFINASLDHPNFNSGRYGENELASNLLTFKNMETGEKEKIGIDLIIKKFL